MVNTIGHATVTTTVTELPPLDVDIPVETNPQNSCNCKCCFTVNYKAKKAKKEGVGTEDKTHTVATKKLKNAEKPCCTIQ